MQLNEITKITNGKLINAKIHTKENTSIKYLSIDSRKNLSPDDTVFFAIVGSRHDGHNYIENIYNKKVRNFVVNDSWKTKILDKFTDANFIFVTDTLVALQKLCSYRRSTFIDSNLPVVGITGSNGKTIVKEWLFQLLHKKLRITYSPGSYNSQVGVPLSVWLLNSDCDLAVFEAGISEVGEMEKLQPILQPTIGIFTNIGDAHQENFQSVEQKVDEKLKLFTESKILIYCKDHEIIDRQIKTNIANGNINPTLVNWSLQTDADLKITKISKSETQTAIHGVYKKLEISTEIPFTDNASIENCIHLWLYMLNAKYDNNYICSRMQNLIPLAMRLELKRGINNCTLINDSYNSDLGSLNIALDFINQQQQHSRKTVILSDILQSNQNETELYSEVLNILCKNNITSLIGIGEAIKRNADLFKNLSEFYCYPTTKNFIENIKKHTFNDELVLIKGSRNFKFERISNRLEYRIHKTVLEINLNAMEHNLNYFRSLLKPKTKIMAMVKALSYGSGSYEIANLLQFQQVDYLGVAYIDEGIELRNAGITLPIVVLNPDVDSYDRLIDYQLEPEIYNFTGLINLHKTCKKYGLKTISIHLKLDTGMKRLGFEKHEIPKLIKQLLSYANIRVASIFSHLVGSDEAIHDEFTIAQIDKFKTYNKQIIDAMGYHIDRHILNSSGIERFPQAQFEMVRLGIGLYGISSINPQALKNISTLKTRISQIKNVSANETIGYGRKGKANKQTRIATITIGYADGISRGLSNKKGQVLINNKLVPIVGNICMDMCMVDITDIEAKEGDDAIIFGDDYAITELAKQLDTIPYEIMTGISQRVKKVYFH